MSYKFINEKGEHRHEIDGRPLIGTSSVSNVISKPLTFWACGLALEKLGWTKIKEKKDGKYFNLPKENRLKVAYERLKDIVGMPPEKYLDLLDEAYYAHSKNLKETAKEGTDLHAELQRLIEDNMKGKPVLTAYDKKIQPFIDWANKNVKRFLWSEIHCFSSKHFIGGISDCGYERHDGTYGIMDFKRSKEAYLSQFWQCAGYDIQISENGGYTANGEKVFTLDKPIKEYAILPFGMEKPEPQFHYDIEGAKEAFLAELLLYKKLNN